MNVFQVRCMMLLMAAGFFLGGCLGDRTSQPQSKENKAVIVGLDETGSYGYFDASLNLLAPQDQDQFFTKGIIGQMHRLDNLGLISIGNHVSYRDVLIPPQRIDYSEFNPNEKIAVLQPLSEQIRTLKLQGFGGTDIFGFLYLAGEALADPQYNDCEKYLIIFSDLGDTENRSFVPDLRGVNVKVYFFSHDLEPEKEGMEIPAPDAWEQRFRSWSAKSVEINDVTHSYGAHVFPEETIAGF